MPRLLDVSFFDLPPMTYGHQGETLIEDDLGELRLKSL
jgi:hypothetical protein